MEPLVQVDKPQNVSPGAEPHLLRGPGEPHPLSWLAPGAEVDELAERTEWLGDAKDDPPHVELAESAQVRPGPVAHWLDDHPIIAGRWQAGQRAPHVGDLEPRQIAADREAHPGATPGLLIDRRHSPPHHPRVEMRLLDQRVGLAPGAGSSRGQDQEAHGTAR